MANEIALPQGFGPVSKVFANQTTQNDELGAGVMSSMGVVGYKGKVWSLRYQGEDKILMRDDGDGPRNSIEVVLVKASPAISKIFYKNGYVDGSNASPDCWSSSGQTPDASVQTKQSPTCAACPMNAWGSRVSEAGKPGKMCSDSRRVAVVPIGDLNNELFGGPMLLRIPAASLKDLKGYGEVLQSYQYPYYAVATRIAFDPQEAYPKFVFSAIRPLKDDEAQTIAALRDDKRVSVVLSEGNEAPAKPVENASEERAASPFEQDPPTQPPAASAPPRPPVQPPAQAAGGFGPAASVASTGNTASAAAPVARAPVEEVIEVGEDGNPTSFDDLLNSILG